MDKRISIIGAGNVGATCAYQVAVRNLGDIVLLDLVEGLARGKALDLMQAGAIEGYDCIINGTADYADTVGSDVVIITAGMARKPGMSREDLVLANTKIVQQISTEVAKYSPDAVLVVVTNPLDLMCYVAYKSSGFPAERVLGMSGLLDSARFRMFLAMELGVSPKDIYTFILGGHGDHMVPLVRYTRVGGVPVEDLLPQKRIQELVERARHGGAEIVELLQISSAYYAPGAAVAQLVETILTDRKRIMPCSVYLKGEFGHHDMYGGVPALIGADGVEKIIEIHLTGEEKAALDRSFLSVKELQAKLTL